MNNKIFYKKIEVETARCCNNMIKINPRPRFWKGYNFVSCQKPKKQKQKKKRALTSVFTPIHSTTKMFKRIQEYFQPKIGRKIRIFSLGRKSNLLIKRKECIYPRMGDGWGGGGGGRGNQSWRSVMSAVLSGYRPMHLDSLRKSSS